MCCYNVHVSKKRDKFSRFTIGSHRCNDLCLFQQRFSIGCIKHRIEPLMYILKEYPLYIIVVL